LATTTDTGKAAEHYACRYLEKQGLKLIEKNYRCRYGEIDLIMRDKKTTVFVEVRYRSNPNFGSGAESINARKQQKLVTTANHFLQHNRQAMNHQCRFDVISLSAAPDKSGFSDNIEWIPNAIEAW
jgi:putative endonuclease